MNPVQSMVNAWSEIYQALPLAIRALASISIISVFLATLFNTLQNLR